MCLDCERARVPTSQRVQAGFEPVFRRREEHLCGTSSTSNQFTQGKRNSRKMELPHLLAVRRGTCGRHQQPVGEGDFTHPRVGQAEHLACRKRLPNAFCGQKPAPTFAQSRASGSSGTRQLSRRAPPVAAVWALCAGLRAGVEAVPMSRAFRRRWAVCGAAAIQNSYDAVILTI